MNRESLGCLFRLNNVILYKNTTYIKMVAILKLIYYNHSQ